MRVYISADLEGISGIVAWEQVAEEGPERSRSAALMLKEVNAAIEGALQGGAEEILVNDSHGLMRNLSIEELHPMASLLTGNLKPFSMVQGVEQGFDLAFFVGYHGAVGSLRSICDHTYSSSSVFEIRWNSQPMSETALNAALCGHCGTAVAMVTGDAETVRQARLLLGEVETVATKEAVSRYAARCRHPVLVREEIQRRARLAASEPERFKPYRIETPVNMEVTFVHSAKADLAELLPGSRRLDGRTVLFQASSTPEAFRALQAFLVLARAA